VILGKGDLDSKGKEGEVTRKGGRYLHREKRTGPLLLHWGKKRTAGPKGVMGKTSLILWEKKRKGELVKEKDFFSSAHEDGEGTQQGRGRRLGRKERGYHYIAEKRRGWGEALVRVGKRKLKDKNRFDSAKKKPGKTKRDQGKEGESFGGKKTVQLLTSQKVGSSYVAVSALRREKKERGRGEVSGGFTPVGYEKKERAVSAGTAIGEERGHR